MSYDDWYWDTIKDGQQGVEVINAYNSASDKVARLRQDNEVLQDQVTSLTTENERLRAQLDRLAGPEALADEGRTTGSTTSLSGDIDRLHAIAAAAEAVRQCVDDEIVAHWVARGGQYVSFRAEVVHQLFVALGDPPSTGPPLSD